MNLKAMTGDIKELQLKFDSEVREKKEAAEQARWELERLLDHQEMREKELLQKERCVAEKQQEMDEAVVALSQRLAKIDELEQSLMAKEHELQEKSALIRRLSAPRKPESNSVGAGVGAGADMERESTGASTKKGRQPPLPPPQANNPRSRGNSMHEPEPAEVAGFKEQLHPFGNECRKDTAEGGGEGCQRDW